MVRWASCPPCGCLSERWWTMRGLEAHATKDPSQPLAQSLRMKQPPCHGSHLVEAPNRRFGHSGINGASGHEQPYVDVDFFCRSVGDPPEMRAIATDATVPFTQVRGNRSRGTDHLIRHGFQRRFDHHRELDRDACCLGGFLGDDEWLWHGDLRGVHAFGQSPGFRSSRVARPGATCMPLTIEIQVIFVNRLNTTEVSMVQPRRCGGSAVVTGTAGLCV
jgi:hypothetical protein